MVDFDDKLKNSKLTEDADDLERSQNDEESQGVEPGDEEGESNGAAYIQLNQQ